MRRTITGRSGGRTMTLGDLRQFLTSIDGIPDDAVVKAKATWGRKLRSVTVEEDDVGFRDYVRAVGVDPGSVGLGDPDTAFGLGATSSGSSSSGSSSSGSSGSSSSGSLSSGRSSRKASRAAKTSSV